MAGQSSLPFASLPNDSATWLSAFDQWMTARSRTSRPLNDASSTVQRAMWQSFVGWCISQDIEPAEITAAELDAYLRGRDGSAPRAELTPRYALRLVRLIERVINHRAQLDGLPLNPCASELLAGNPVMRYANDPRKDPLPEVLTDAEDRRLVAFLEASVPRRGRPTGGTTSRWQDLRNRASVALQRGAGLTPLEVRLLRVPDVHVDIDPRKAVWKVRAPATGLVAEHDAPVAKWAAPLIAAWLDSRAAMSIPGDWLLPSTRTGKPWGKTAQFEAVAAVLDAAGLPGHGGGGYIFRHTFALRQLGKNSEATVAAWLGIAEPEMARYRHVLTGPVNVT